MKSKIKAIIFFFYFFLIFLLARNPFKINPSFFIDFILWMAGGFLGAFFVKLDQLFYIYYSSANEPLSLLAKQLIKDRQLLKAWRLLKENVFLQKLAFRSALFQLIWIMLAFFTLTSTNVIFGKTMIMAIGLHLLLDEWQSYKNYKNINWLFWQIKRPVSIKEQKRYLYIMTAAFVILSLFLL